MELIASIAVAIVFSAYEVFLVMKIKTTWIILLNFLLKKAKSPGTDLKSM